MNVEEHYRVVLEELTDEPVGGPELGVSLAVGRRRRRVRRTVAAGGAVAAVALAGAGGAWLQRPHEVVTPDSFASAPSYHDFVAGTQIDETMQATIAGHVPLLDDADKVYPSDWNHDGALPDAEAQNATDWEAQFSLGPNEAATVSMFKKIPGEPSPRSCTTKPQPAAADRLCWELDRPDGSVTVGYTMDLGTFYRIVTVHTQVDGSLVQVFDDVEADSPAAAQQRASLPSLQVAALLEDPAMTFPDPVVTPPPPSGS